MPVNNYSVYFWCMCHDELGISICALLALTGASKGDSVMNCTLNDINISSIDIVFTAAPVLPWYPLDSGQGKATWTMAPVSATSSIPVLCSIDIYQHLSYFILQY